VIVALHIWRVPSHAVPAAVLRVARNHVTLRRTPDLRFGKVLGTGGSATFTPGDATPRRWALLTVWDSAAAVEVFDGSPTVRRWNGAAQERWRVLLEPLSARGRWSGRAPFGEPRPQRDPGSVDRPVAALTRARIAPLKLVTFWRAVPPVSADLHRCDGLLLALGVGEAPIGLQGTFSVWRSGPDLTAFAHRRGPHVEAIRRTTTEGWYAEELFARFSVVEAAGLIDGRNPLASPP
jgi:heme-degrading monooxygenase HmoA